MPRTWIEHWNPEDADFWEGEGKRIARRNLIFSIFAEFLGFSVWQIYSVVAVNLSNVGFKFSVSELFLLASLPGLVGATMRFPYTVAVPRFGGRNWTVVSALLLLIPTLLVGFLVQNPSTPFWLFAVAAATAGFGGGNFASSMANISFFYPDKRKGLALGLNAGGGNLGVSVVQFAIPFAITVGLFGSLGGPAETLIKNGAPAGQMWLQNAGFFWVPLILVAAICAWLFMDNLSVSRARFSDQASILKSKHTYLMSWLYIGTFGSFIGYGGAFPLLIKTQFPGVNPLQFAFLGPLVGSLIRPLGGWLSDRLGGTLVTLWNFAVMIAAVVGVIASLNVKNFTSFFVCFLVLFATAGIGNGSTFRMIPSIFRNEHLARAASSGRDRALALKDAGKDTAAVLGFSSAVGAYGGFLVPNSYSTSIAATGGVQAALVGFIAFYVTCIGITWWCYLRTDLAKAAPQAEAAPKPAATAEPAAEAVA
jgi:NNP family nitrate/nitrite transporter-like MFS transporter